MTGHHYAAFATAIALFVYLWTFIRCGDARRRFGIKAPAVTGNAEFERYYRVQMNTIEQMVLFLPCLWLFSLTVSDVWGGLLGLVWCVGRVLYGIAYAADPEKRGPGFMIGFGAAMILLLVGFLRLLWLIVAGS